MPPSLPLFATDALWRDVFWTSYLAWSAMELWVFSRDRRAARGEYKDRGSRRLIMLLVFAGLFGAFFVAYCSSSTRIAAPDAPLFWTGIGLIWVGMALRIWAVLTLGPLFRTSVFVLEDHRLVTSGPYWKLRNPSYTGGLLSLVGIGLAMGNWLSLACAAGALVLAYVRRIAVEEKALSERFGQAWVDYRRRSWALIPPIW